MTLSGPELEKHAEPLWFCLRAHPRQEALAAARLRQLDGTEVFAPRVRFRKATRRGPVWFVEALFPGYLFARFRFFERHRQVRSLPGVSTVVGFGSRVAVVDAGTVDQLKLALGAREEITFDPVPAPGDAVRLVQGPFDGLETVVTRLLPARERVCVLLDFLGRQVEAEVRAEEVLPAGSVRKPFLPFAS